MKTQKPKIAILVPRFGLVERGVENFTFELCKLLKDDLDITIFSQVKSKSYVKKVLCIPENNLLVQIVYKLLPKNLRDWLNNHFLDPIGLEMLSFSIFCFPKLLSGKFDLLFPQNGVWGAIICRLIRVIKGTPFIYRSAGGREPTIVRQKPDIYVATTPEIKDWIIKMNPNLKVEMIPNGVNLKKFSSHARAIKLDLKKPIFLCVGALINSKRIDLAISAISKLKNGSLVILGKGPLEKRLAFMGHEFLGQKRFLIKPVKYSKIPSYYKASDVFTLPSQDEPFGIVYLEALASNLPIVAPNDKSRQFIIEKSGKLCNVTNIKEYARALETTSKTDYGRKPNLQAQKFSFTKISNQYKSLIHNLV